MTIAQLLNHIRPDTLAQLVAEVLADFADEDNTGEFTFHTENAGHLYSLLLAAGRAHAGEDEFHQMIERALAYEDR